MISLTLFSAFFQFAVSQLFWFTLHYLTWDFDDTRPGEEFNMNALIDQFTDPEVAFQNVLANLGASVGMVSGEKSLFEAFTELAEIVGLNKDQ
jgi:hypothetical protein